jgi:hypothetical protein
VDRINAIEAYACRPGRLPASRVGGALRELFLEMNGVAPARRVARHGHKPPLRSIARRIAAPTLRSPDLDAGRATTLPAVGENLSNARAGSQLPLPNLEQPTEFNRELQAFLSRLRS